MLLHLAKKHDVHLVSFEDGEILTDQLVHAADKLASVYLVRTKPWVQKLRGLWGLLTGRSATELAYPRTRARRYIASLEAEAAFDYVLLSSGAMASVVAPALLSARTVMDFIDVDSDKWRAYADKSNPFMALVYRREARALSAFECRVAGQVAASLLVSEAEADLLRARVCRGVEARIHSVENGVDAQIFDPARYSSNTSALLSEGGQPAQYNTPAQPITSAELASFSVLFTGVMTYAPNIEAVCWFHDTQWPLVKAQYPEAVLRIAGAPVDSRVAKLAVARSVEVTGFVRDMAAELARAHVVIAPLLQARGVQNKVLEAMAMAKPVVVSPAALEGLYAQNNQEVLVASVDCKKSSTDFAKHVIRLLSDDTLRAQLGLAARARVLESYSWQSKMAKLDTVLASIK